tara:strand:- start:467 stop:955 length:489 start_codon:yes stop_codon:yes gene_type:complete
MIELSHDERRYIQRAINVEHWICINGNALRTCQQIFSQYMDMQVPIECLCEIDNSPEAEAFRACQPAMGLMFDLLCAISRNDFSPDSRDEKFDGIVRQPNMLPKCPPSTLIPIEGTKLMYDKDQLETILYVFEGYMQGNDDDELVQKMELICERTSILLEEN